MDDDLPRHGHRLIAACEPDPHEPPLGLPALLLVVTCGTVPDADRDGAGDAVRHAGSGTVLESPEHGPQLCLGGVATTLPPQCGGVPLIGWDWSRAAGEQSINGTTWGDYRVVGVYDGASLTLTEPPGGAERPPREDAAALFATPCDEPAGGWDVPDRARAGEDDVRPAAEVAMAQADYAALWIDRQGASLQSAAPAGAVILNVAFTGDLGRHERELRPLWGGPLCVLQLDRTSRELHAVQDELVAGAADALGLEMLQTSVLEHRGVVELGVVAATPEQRAAVDERFGVGVVVVQAGLEPLP